MRDGASQIRRMGLLVGALVGLLPASWGAPAAGDGKEVTSPTSMDSVRFRNFRQKLTLDEIERLWPDVAREEIVRQMGTVRHPKTVEFLYRVAIVDPILYKGKMPKGYTFGEFAIDNLVRTGHRSVPEKLDAILRAPMEHVQPEERRTIKNHAARKLLGFDGASRELIYQTLDSNAKAGAVACPYSRPSSFRRPNGSWIDPPVESQGRDLMRKWLDELRGVPRLQTARCMAEAGIQDSRLFGLAQESLGATPEHRAPVSDERFLAEQILKALSAHGQKEAEKAHDKMEMEQEIKRLRIPGHPEEDNRIRERHEEEFRKKWAK